MANTENTQKSTYTYSTVGGRIRQRRIELNLTQEELALRLGNKSRASVCTVETGREDLTTDRVRKYADALECSPGYIMGWETIDGIPIESQNEVDPKRLERALQLYDLYEKTPAEIQSAVYTMLESTQHK